MHVNHVKAACNRLQAAYGSSVITSWPLWLVGHAITALTVFVDAQLFAAVDARFISTLSRHAIGAVFFLVHALAVWVRAFS